MKLTAATIALLAVVSTAAPVRAQTVSTKVPRSGDWIGTFEWHDSRGDIIERIMATLTFSEDHKTVTGTWRSLGRQATGSINATLDEPTMKLKAQLTLFSGSEKPLADGTTEQLDPEGCAGETSLSGVLVPGPILRFSSPRLTSKARKNRPACEEPTRLLWTLQPLPR